MLPDSHLEVSPPLERTDDSSFIFRPQTLNNKTPGSPLGSGEARTDVLPSSARVSGVPSAVGPGSARASRERALPLCSARALRPSPPSSSGAGARPALSYSQAASAMPERVRLFHSRRTYPVLLLVGLLHNLCPHTPIVPPPRLLLPVCK